MRTATTHHLAVAPWNYVYLPTGQKHFIVIPDTMPPLGYGDRLVLTLRGHPGQPPIVRWVRYLENGAGYAPGYVGVELSKRVPGMQTRTVPSVWANILAYLRALRN